MINSIDQKVKLDIDCGRNKKDYITIPINKDKDAERRKDAGDFPDVVLIDTVNYCNLRCSMCGRRKMTRPGGIMDFKLYQKIVDEIAIKNKKARVWLVFFGDPFMLQDRFYPLVTYAKEKGLEDVVVNTNGMLMNEHHSKKLIESGLDAIYIGIDGFNPETYSKLRVGGKYEMVVTNVKKLLEIKCKMKAEKPAVFVQFVEMKENEHEKEDFIKYWTQQGALVKVRPRLTFAGGTEAPNLDPNKKRYPCYSAMRTINILYDGRVCLCASDYDGKFIAGNVWNESIQSIWLGPLKKLRRLHSRGEYSSLPPICRDCLDWQAMRAEFYTRN
ncbi:MAG: radical SAM/SPASM domain-containing protein [Patescibacteria group bacterium]|nr:radical SAM/SPASM domain-containing protein [Patescibacteria group bacterium]